MGVTRNVPKVGQSHFLNTERADRDENVVDICALEIDIPPALPAEVAGVSDVEVERRRLTRILR